MSNEEYLIRWFFNPDDGFFYFTDDERETTKFSYPDVESILNHIEGRRISILQKIDNKIKELEYDLDRCVKAGMPTGELYSLIELLEELKEII